MKLFKIFLITAYYLIKVYSFKISFTRSFIRAAFAVLFLQIINVNLFAQTNISNQSSLDKSAADSILTTVGRWGWGPCYTFDADSQYAFIGNGSLVQTFDLSDPANPIMVGQYLTDGLVYDIKILDNKAYICIGAGLLILDVSNPYQITELVFVAIPAGAFKQTIEPGFDYVLTYGALLWIIDISDPTNPTVRNNTDVSSVPPGLLASKDNIVYVTDPTFAGVGLVNVSNPDTLSGTLLTETRIRGMYVADTLLFLSGDYTQDYGISIYSIADAANPVFLSRTYTNGQDITTFTRSDSILYAKSDSALERFNISDPYNPQLTNTISYGALDGTGKLEVFKNYFLTQKDIGFESIQIVTSDSLSRSSFFPTGYQVTKIRVRNNLAFIASAYAGVWIVDVSDPSHPVNIANVNPGGYATDIYAEDSLLYLTTIDVQNAVDTLNSIYLIDIKNPNKPEIIRKYHTSSSPNSIAVSKNKIFLTEYSYTINSASALEILNKDSLTLWQNISDYRPAYPVVNDSLLIYEGGTNGYIKIFRYKF